MQVLKAMNQFPPTLLNGNTDRFATCQSGGVTHFFLQSEPSDYGRIRNRLSAFCGVDDDLIIISPNPLSIFDQEKTYLEE